MQLAYDAVIYCDPLHSSQQDSQLHCLRQAIYRTITATVATLLDAHRQHGTRAVISNSDTPETREIYLLSISTPSAFAALSAPKAAIWPVK